MSETEKLPNVVDLHPMTDRITEQYLEIRSDDVGIGNGSHHYQVLNKVTGELLLDLKFQHGGVNDVGLNGVLTPTLLQIIHHHLSGFQKGPFPSRETAVVLTKLDEALQWSKQRELDRAKRGVLGQATK